MTELTQAFDDIPYDDGKNREPMDSKPRDRDNSISLKL